MQNITKRIIMVQALALILFLCLWHVIAVNYNNSNLFPSPYFVITNSFPGLALFSGYQTPSFIGAVIVILTNSFITILRIIIGSAVGIIAGIIYGLLIHLFRKSRFGNATVLSFARAIPLFALVPLFLHWFGGNDMSIYIYISFAVFIVIATNTYQSVFNISPSYLHQARLLGANRFQAYQSVVIPAILQELVGGIRNIIGLSWAFSLGAEYLSARNGIGYLLYSSYLYADMGKMIILGCVYSTLGISSYYLSLRLVAFVKKWN